MLLTINEFVTNIPTHFMSGLSFEAKRYAIGTLGVFFAVWIILRPFLQNRAIRTKRPMLGRQIRMELFYSLRTMLIFVALDMFIFGFADKGVFKFYFDIGEKGALYYWASIGLAIIFHDTYFYWAHRIMHHSRFYKRLHLTHHRSYNPTPFTAYSFAVGEAIIEYGYVPIMLLILPIHPSALAIVLMIMIFKNALAHSGYELFLRGATRHWFWKHFTTVTHHDMHHEKGNGNFGFYFTWWDKVMGTEHVNYHERFDAVTAGKETKALAV